AGGLSSVVLIRLTWLGASIPTPSALASEFSVAMEIPDVVRIRSVPATRSTVSPEGRYPVALEGGATYGNPVPTLFRSRILPWSWFHSSEYGRSTRISEHGRGKHFGVPPPSPTVNVTAVVSGSYPLAVSVAGACSGAGA